ncbi:phosphorylase [Halomicrococcus sp. NG-SE-24]|uniref:phosphorylase family protein n=1 Tax=Halomicrococcus sp. NG-SE-24 TaxID=3436928 RepID=UPI003D96F659
MPEPTRDDPGDAATPVEPDVVVLPAFAAGDVTVEADLPNEVEPWLDEYAFDRELAVPGANAPVRYTDDGVAITPTGMGKADAAATVTALLRAPGLDCSDAAFLTVGIAGASPEAGTLGSVFIADHVVDWDRKQRWDGAGDDDPVETMRLLPYRPRDYAYGLDDDFVERAYGWASDVALRDTERAREHRERYSQDAARGAPTVAVGTTLCGDEFWHGARHAEAARWLVDRYDAGEYATTEMEDFGTAAALDRFDRLESYLSVRGVVNFDRPPEGRTAREGIDEDLDAATVELGLENAFRVGSRIVDRLVE